MTFGSGGRQVALWLVAIFVGLYPLALLLTVVSSWAAHRRGQVRHAFRRNLLPLLWVVPMLALFVWANL
jgi:H+/Cl- antiporter ClcA